MTLLEKIIRLVENFLGVIGLVAVSIATLGVFTRFVLKISIAWSDEILRTIFVWSYFIGVAILYRSSGLMRLELAEEYLKNNGKRRLYRLLCIAQETAMLVFFGTIGYYGYSIVMTQMNSGQMTTTSSTPAWVLPMGFVVGVSLIVLFSIGKILQHLKRS